MDIEENTEEISVLRESGRTYISLQTDNIEISRNLSDNSPSDEAQSEHESFSKPELSMDELDSKISLACYDAKKKITEISNLKSAFLEQYDVVIKQVQNKYMEELKKNSEELRKIKLLAESYQSTVQLKENIIGKLVEAIREQKDRYESCKTFYSWRLKCLDIQREKYFYAFATKHYEDCLKRKVFNSWRAATELKWKDRIEYRVRLELQDHQQQVIEDYEVKLKSLEEELKESKEKIDVLQSNHKAYEDMMKQALMRGVCALNMEAMSVLYNSSELSSQPSVANLSVPHLPGYPADKPGIPTDVQPCSECLLCPSEIMSDKIVKCVSPVKDALPEQAVLSKTTKVHHSSMLKCIPMMGTANVPSLAARMPTTCPHSVYCQVPTVSIKRHINKSTSSLSGGLRSSNSRDQLRRS